MRERWASRIAALTCLLVLGLTVAFAAVRNQAPATAARVAAAGAGTDAVDAERAAAGREVYASLDCAGCHSIAGQGSARSPLDGVGSRLGRDEIRDWILGGDAIAEELSPRALRIKHGYRELEADRIDALVEYMRSLTE